MKKTFTFLAICLLTISSFAQKGQWYAGGQIGFGTSNNKTISGGVSSNTYKNSNWSFSPEIGTFLSNHLQLGTAITFSGNNSKDLIITNNKSKSNLYGGTIYSRFFWGKEAFKPFAGVSIRYSEGKIENQNGTLTYTSKQSNFGAEVNAGFSYALSKRVAALGSFGFLGYNSTVSRPSNSSDKYKSNSFGFDAGSLGNRFNIGFYYTLTK